MTTHHGQTGLVVTESSVSPTNLASLGVLNDGADGFDVFDPAQADADHDGTGDACAAACP